MISSPLGRVATVSFTMARLESRREQPENVIEERRATIINVRFMAIPFYEDVIYWEGIGTGKNRVGVVFFWWGYIMACLMLGVGRAFFLEVL